MKLQIVTRYYLPVKAGVETHCYEIAKRALAIGHLVKVITRDDGFDHGSSLPAEETMEGVMVCRSPSNLALSKGIDFQNPVYLNNFDTSLTLFLFTRALFAKPKGTKPNIWLVPHGGFTPYWEHFPLFQRILKKAYHRTFGTYFINRLTCGVSALNTWEKEQLIGAGVNEDLIVVRTNGVEDPAFDLPPQRLEDHGFGHLGRERYLLMLCRISREKNIDRVIKALSTIENASLVIGGSIQDKTYFNELRTIISIEGLDDRVHFVGYVSGEGKYALLDQSAAVVLMSLYECDPIAVKEALVRGRMVIASNVGPLPSMVTDGENGFLAEPEDIKSISAAFTKGMSLSPNDRRNIEENNKKKGIHYGWGAVTTGLLKDLEKCEGKGNG